MHMKKDNGYLDVYCRMNVDENEPLIDNIQFMWLQVVHIIIQLHHLLSTYPGVPYEVSTHFFIPVEENVFRLH